VGRAEVRIGRRKKKGVVKCMVGERVWGLIRLWS
jgi:hypothetical protein